MRYDNYNLSFHNYVEHNRATECEKYATVLYCRIGKNTGGKWSKKMAALNASTFDVFQVFRLALLSNDWTFKRNRYFCW